ncbi:16S rRNA (cytosine967-C5)-methyltransferase [Natranaerovirga hydrolytica]|uniref:16S rRNA (cytosine(967)-C(5))-methyltransferase n=1 Tax=Natranaerovirga hydrolytica TaxID=680378 RepID=A0A4R1MYV4_9FIRM|nr:16S rRNA (cytosine(967)-C(5))-methyltransferase RsmB [Natranaerovirga hydrolytica]TCK98335.1 16S rRNA (cytosine967-C5)-methyltransferase [Natranaerovirga hydrolytica]
MSQINTRMLALNALEDITTNKVFSNKALNTILKKHQDLSKQDRAFLTRLVEGTLEHLIQLDYIINQFSKTKTNKMKKQILNILRISVYQLKYMDSIPDSAVCNEAVKLAKKKGFIKLSGFVNGVLRNIARSLEDIEMPNETSHPIRYLSVMYSFPEWIIQLWLEQYNYETIKTMCQESNKTPKTTIRCNKTLITPDALKEMLKDKNIIVEEGQLLDYAFNISKYNYLQDIDAFNKGYFQIQDESSMLVAEVASPKETDKILDVCAAPGGKTTHLSEITRQKALIIARDISQEKTNLIQENIKRLNLENIRVEVWDALIRDEASIEQYDVVIADLPCSGLGIISKKPDIKYNVTHDQIQSLVNIQRNILTVIQEYVKPGGTLIYSTCTINKEENDNNLYWFEDNFPYKREDITPLVSDKIKPYCQEGYLQILPQYFNTDGFFISKLRKDC